MLRVSSSTFFLVADTLIQCNMLFRLRISKMSHLSNPGGCRGRSSRGPSGRRGGVAGNEGSYLVDPASSHMLVSKIKPCMCKYELVQTVKLRMAH